MSQKQQEIPVIYYENELEDEFSTARITPKTIDSSYDYDGGILRKTGRFFLYRLIVTPLAFLYLKIKYHHKIVNRNCLKQARDTGFFLYGNHTNPVADALIPTILCCPAGASVIVHPNNVSMPVLGKITPSLGAIPLPDDRSAMKNFQKALNQVMEKKEGIAIYPEAHIWPYYTGIRNFKDSSFRYPVQYQVPVFCFTNTYHKKRFGKTPKIITYMEGPFYAKEEGSLREQKKNLHAQVMASMKENSKKNTVELIRYVKKETES